MSECPECGVTISSSVGQEESDRRLANHRFLAHRFHPVRDAANALADARVRFAQEFGRLKILNPQMTDKAAIYAATENTNDEVTRLEAELEIARRTA